jgi:hypothetical protein
MASALPARSGHGWHCGRKEAGEGTRTLDIQLGKLALYQLSYARDDRIVAQAGANATGGPRRSADPMAAVRRRIAAVGIATRGGSRGRCRGTERTTV